MSLKEAFSKPLFLAVTSTCPFCHNALRLAASQGIKPTVITLDKIANGSKLRQELTTQTKQSTVPYVFSNNRFIGGYSDLAKEPSQFWEQLKHSQNTSSNAA